MPLFKVGSENKKKFECVVLIAILPYCMCKWLILSVKVRMAIPGKSPGIAIYCHRENLMLFSPNNQILSTFHRSFSLQSINVLQASTERKKAFCFQ